ncbi:MAG: hypothetical protein ACYSOO_01760, partial [Planctomycetota bacterium]
MITKTDITTCSQNQTHPVHVLFVGNRPVSEELTNHLNKTGYLWDRISSSDFNSCIHSRNILGTVVFDAATITTENAAVFQELFKQLDQRGISIIIHKCPDSILLDELPLASKMDS